MKQRWKPYAVWILLTEAVGALAGWLTRAGTRLYAGEIVKPPLSPPGIVFPVGAGMLILLYSAFTSLRYREKLDWKQKCAFFALVCGICGAKLG